MENLNKNKFNFINECDLFDFDNIELDNNKKKDQNKENFVELNKISKENNNKLTKRQKDHLKIKEKIKYENYLKVKDMNEKEKDIYYKKLREEKKLQKIEDKKIMELAYNSNFKIVFDLNFYDCMKKNEIVSMISQIKDCYGYNRKNINKISFYLTNLNEEDENIMNIFNKMGYENWIIHKYKEEFYNIKELLILNKEFVYLSPDSENELNDIDENKIYIIGGLVDKSILKNKTIFRVNNIKNDNCDIKISTAKLPLKKYVSNLRKTVLNINTVVEIISNYIDTKNWEESIIKVIPKHNFFKEKEIIK